jgi:hypothetical protein
MHLQQAPSVRTRSKTRESDHDRERAIWQALQGARCSGNDRLLPVYFRGRRIAWVASDLERYVVLRHESWMDKHVDRVGRLFGWTRIDHIIRDSTQFGQACVRMWSKNIYNSGLLTPRWHHLHGVAGNPGANTFAGTALQSKRHSDALDMGIDHGGNVSPMVKFLLGGGARIGATGTFAETALFLLYDLVVSYDQCGFVAGSQSMSTTAGVNDALRYVGTNDPGLVIMPMTTAANGNIAYTSLAYTSDTGTAPEGAAAVTTSLQTVFTSAAPTAGDQWVSAIEYSGSHSMLSIPLRAGDTGVKQIDSFTMGTTVAGQIAFLLGGPLGWFPVHGGDYYHPMDFVKITTEEPVILDGACLTWVMHSVSLNQVFSGHLNFAWGS